MQNMMLISLLFLLLTLNQQSEWKRMDFVRRLVAGGMRWANWMLCHKREENEFFNY